MNKILLLGVFVCFISLSYAQNTTQAPPVTTTVAPVVPFNFTIPKNSSVPACLRAQFLLTLNIKYPGTGPDGKPANLTTDYVLRKVDDFDGVCNDAFNTLQLTFEDNWIILFNYTLSKDIYQLDRLRFEYVVNEQTFPNATIKGRQVVEQAGLNEFSAAKDNSFKCTSETKVDVNNTVTFDFTSYQAQPFSGSEKKGFDTAVECAADLSGTSKLVPIIVGSSLAVLVLLVLVAYIFGRRKHRPGYQQV